ncbi:MAG: hypothetical protein HY824_10145 [Acidobacteria bacterium]|nr:hypothetical protein [Acidobacteriota bacterium]
MRPRTFADLYDRIHRLAKKTDADNVHLRARIDQAEQNLAAQIAAGARESRADAVRMQESVDALVEQVKSQGQRIEQLTAIQHADWKHRERIAAWSRLDREAVAAHVRSAVARAEVGQDPCPHLVITGLFPPAFFEMMVEALPPAILFADRRVNKQQLRVPFGLAPRYSREVWQFVSDLMAGALGPALVARLAPDIEAWVQTVCPAATPAQVAALTYKVSDGRIMLRRAGYEIRPHRDPKWGFVTGLIYLPRPGDPTEFGTELYRVRDDSEAPSGLPYYIDPAACELVRKVPFAPNSALVFLNSRGAHGASVPADAPASLERYLYQFRVGPSHDSISTLLELMDEDVRARWTGDKMTKALEAY